MKCLHCGKALALAEKLKYHDFCSATHQKAFATDRDWAEFQNRIHQRDDEEGDYVPLSGLEQWRPTVSPQEGTFPLVAHPLSPASMTIGMHIPRFVDGSPAFGAAAPVSAGPLPPVRIAAARVRLRFAEPITGIYPVPGLESLTAVEEPWLIPMAGRVYWTLEPMRTSVGLRAIGAEALPMASAPELPDAQIQQQSILSLAGRLRMLPLSVKLRRTAGGPLLLDHQGRTARA